MARVAGDVDVEADAELDVSVPGTIVVMALMSLVG